MSMQTIRLKAIRTNLSIAKYNGEDWEEKGLSDAFDTSKCTVKEVDVVVAYGMASEIAKKPTCMIVEGEVTGYESFYMEDIMGHVGALSWCAGTPGRWDQLLMDRKNTVSYTHLTLPTTPYV